MALKTTDPKIFDLIKNEEKRQKETICLIASENYTSAEVREAIGSVLTNKYSEGYPHKRYYAGQINVDEIEEIAKERALSMFGLNAESWHANVQPYSGSPANAEIYLAMLEFGDTVMGMRLDQGGHITHGLPISFAGRAYKFVSYGVDAETEMLDYDEILKIAKECQPKMIVCGATAYSRTIDFKKFRKIADAVGALLLADISHIAGLIVGGAHPSCFPYTDIAMTTTHKTLRGPRSAIIICKTELAEKIDKAVFPGLQGGPHDHITAAKAICFAEAMAPDFKKYAVAIVKNCQALADALQTGGL
ncbi:MAG TPA: serine hydroxymethyltransferase, partial [Patescibacteria group bacterium]|nr:serine hydroxymethyltransferase [Patescibacteria group bacterium]